MKSFNQFIKENLFFTDKKQMCKNIIQFTVPKVDEDIIDEFQHEFPDKWIIPSTSYGNNWIFVKDKPEKYEGKVPNKIYHVSTEKPDNILMTGIKPSTKLESPFGYYDLTFFYLNKSDALCGGVTFIEGKNYLFEIDTSFTDNWLEDVNRYMDEEEDIITTSEIVPPEYIVNV